MWIKICLFLIVFVCVTANLVDGALVEICQPDGNTLKHVGQYSNRNYGYGQSFWVDEPGLILESQIYFSSGSHKNFLKDEIICELRDSEGTILQNSSIPGFYYYDKGWKSFPFNKNVSSGYYILTLYVNSNSVDYYGIGFNYKDPYPNGTCYYFSGDFDDCDNWDSWGKYSGDLMFKVVIETEGNSIKTPTKPKGSPPDTPSKPAGPSQSFTEIECLFITTTTDPDNDQIKYTFDWGDGTISNTKFVNSSFSASEKHSWNFSGDYSIKVMATDSNGSISSWSEKSRIIIESLDKERIEKIVEKKIHEKLLAVGQQIFFYLLSMIGLYILLNKLRLFEFIVNQSFKLIGKLGFDQSKFKATSIGKLIKYLIELVTIIASVITIYFALKCF